ncbi:MAG TPA: hypothetical protein DCG38_09380 [Eubacteriaceae bacterium]|jgi:uncharacterized protein YabE (DUF348 family)|nr:hypothetical protein [Eubacteriaceae bacterium]
MKKFFKKDGSNQVDIKKVLIILAIMVLSITGVGYTMSFNQVMIIDDGVETEVMTRKDTVREVLAENEIDYISQDGIYPGLESSIEDQMTVQIHRAVNVSIKADDTAIDLLTPAENVEKAIKEAGLKLGDNDHVSAPLDEALEEGMTIKITRALDCTVDVDGQTYELATTAKNVGEVLVEANVSLKEEDKVNYDFTEKVQNGMKIIVTRVTKEVIEEEESVSYKTIRRSNSSMEVGKTKVVQSGKKGLNLNTVEVTYEDGVEVNRKTLETKVVKKPIDEIVNVGTRIIASRGSTESGSYRTLTVTATAYSSQDPGVGTRTATGRTLQKGIIAVDTRVIPFGTKIYVPGYGYGIAADRGGAIKGNKIDVAFNTRREALQFGRRTVTIRIYD